MRRNPIKPAILYVALLLIASGSFAQTTWPCAQYLTRQVPNGNAYMTNISYVYDLGTVPVTVTVAKTDTLLNASAIYNGNIWAWKQYTGTAQSGSAGARLIKVNYNSLDSTVKPTLTGYSFPSITMGCNAAFVDPNGIYYVINTATSGATNFILSRINLATATPTLLTNLTVNLPKGSTVGSGGLGDLVYRNDSVFALVNNVGLFRFALPSLSTTTVSPNLIGSTINRTVGSLFSINSDANNIYGYGSANGATSQDRLLKISTQTGVVTELTTSGVSVSQSDGAGCPSTDFSQPTVFLNISGKIFDDGNGLKGIPANTIDGTGTNASGALYAQVLDGTNTVEETIPVGSDGTYTFTGLTPGTYTVLINNSSTASTSTTLPSNWVNTGENIGTGAGSDGNVNGKSATITLTLNNVANVNFGIEQLPTANNVTASSQLNPGGINKVTVPTLNGSDPEQGTLPGTGNLDTVIINTLPINGTLYYNNVAVNAGDTIKNYNPSLLTLDPNSGAITVSFTYSEVDAVVKSGNAATVSMPFTAISASGNVYDDGNGLQDNTVNGIGTNAGGTLYAQLLDSTNKVIATTAVNNDGTYSFVPSDPGTYSVVLNTYSTGDSLPSLPVGFINTGEHVGTGAGSDGAPNGIIKFFMTTVNFTNINFGIEQFPTANAVTAAAQVNPGGTNTVAVPTLNGTDPEQGIFSGTDNADTIIINSLPSNGTLYYNNVAIPAGDTIKNYNPSLLTIDPNSGVVTVSFTYSEVDAALKTSAPATVTIPFIQMSISGIVLDDANGLTDNTVNGIGTNAGGLNALLIDAGSNNVIATTNVAADGTYSFTGLDGGNYSIEITTATATSGAAAPAITLPSGWVSTGENLGTAAGSDGVVNSILPLGTIATSISNADFGVEQLPVSNTQSFNIPAPIANSAITLDGTGQDRTPTPLAGSDPEDGILGSANNIIITTVPVNALLYYNGTVITNNTLISNYDPTQLQIKFTEPASLNTSFQYEVVDAAGNHSATPATYLLSWASALPVVLSSFTAEKENNSTLLSWTTSSEINVKVFNIERSVDNGKTWQAIGEVAATGHSTVTREYSFTDDNPESGTNLYRLQIEDDNSSTTYSGIVNVEFENESSMNVYPNPVGEDEALNIQLTGLKQGQYHIRLISSSGQTIKDMTFTISNSGSALLVIPTGTMTRGSYVVVVSGNDLQYTKTVIVANR